MKQSFSSPRVCLLPRRSRNSLILKMPGGFSQPRLVQRPFRNPGFKAVESWTKCRSINVIKPKMLKGRLPRRWERFIQVGMAGRGSTCRTGNVFHFSDPESLFHHQLRLVAHKGVWRTDGRKIWAITLTHVSAHFAALSPAWLWRSL